MEDGIFGFEEPETFEEEPITWETLPQVLGCQGVVREDDTSW